MTIVAGPTVRCVVALATGTGCGAHLRVLWLRHHEDAPGLGRG